jgi:trans-2,3-dihydro-3-hydroxyanthranilate isomerase
MTTIRYRLLNVFAETAFGGNPLAVIEDASALSDADMLAVARQFNLSETTFLLPSQRAAARVRIFTPGGEMAFAGHPTLGSAQVVRELTGAADHFDLELKAGLIAVRADAGRWSLTANAALCRATQATPAQLAAMLGLPESGVDTAMWVNSGTEQLLIELAGADLVRACRPNAALLAALCRNADGQVKAYVFARTPTGFEARYFSMSDETSIREDPGTGSACANLGGWWQATEGDAPLAAEIEQGAQVHRPCRLSLTVNDGRIEVGGRVIELGQGQLHW